MADKLIDSLRDSITIDGYPDFARKMVEGVIAGLWSSRLQIIKIKYNERSLLVDAHNLRGPKIPAPPFSTRYQDLPLSAYIRPQVIILQSFDI